VALPFQHSDWIFPALIAFNLAVIALIITIVRKKRII
jgi:hypothetical protein